MPGTGPGASRAPQESGSSSRTGVAANGAAVEEAAAVEAGGQEKVANEAVPL